MKVLITGARGFIGQYLLARLNADSRFEVESTDREDCDVGDFDGVAAVTARTRPDAVCHLAALCGAAPSRAHPREYYRVNTQGTVNVLDACRLAGVRSFVLASSLTVFGRGDEAKREGSPHAPRHPYAASKSAAEGASRIYAKEFGLRCAIVRPTLVVGAGCKEPHAIGDFVQKAIRGETIELQGRGDHRRDFVHPRDVADAFTACLLGLERSNPGTCDSFNISEGTPISMKELADFIVSRVGRGGIAFAPSTNQTFSLFADIERARVGLDFKPRFSIDQIVAEMIRENQEIRPDAFAPHDDRRYDDQRSVLVA